MYFRDNYTSCDFPGCSEEIDQRKDAKKAILKDGKPLKFCEGHSLKLLQEGVQLLTWADVCASRESTKREVAEKERVAQERAAAERAFIQGFK